MKIGVYVGSFNPVHKGHINIAKHLLSNHYIDKIIIVPTGNYWDKQNIVSINHRIKMLSFYETDNIIIEKELNALPYTYLVLEQLQKKHYSDQLYLIIGADILPNLNLWKEIDQILNNKILVLPRNEIDALSYINTFSNKNNFEIVKNFKNINISSTEIRKNTNNIVLLKRSLDEDVINYIKVNNLYLDML